MSSQAEGAGFERIFNEYKGLVFRVAFGVLRDRDRAEDATQEAFIRIHANLAKFEGRSSLKTWIYRLTVNSALNQLRKRPLGEELREEHSPQDPGNPSSHAEGAELADRLAKAVRALPERQQAAFMLKQNRGQTGD